MRDLIISSLREKKNELISSNFCLLYLDKKKPGKHPANLKGLLSKFKRTEQGAMAQLGAAATIMYSNAKPLLFPHKILLKDSQQLR